MNRAFFPIAFLLSMASMAQQPPAGQLEQLAAKDDSRPSEQVYKNIQVLKGMPASQVVNVMKDWTGYLGVRCEFCHVTAPGSKIPGFNAWSKDDLQTKQTARKMAVMVAAIGKEFFPGQQGPTCWTCHRGNSKPEIQKPSK